MKLSRMRIRIEKRIIDGWVKDLKRAGPREIGGVLFGEQLDEGYFQVVEAPTQASGIGTYGRFYRAGVQARKQTLSMHRSYDGPPERFNYLGEWHSHPNAPVVPSTLDEMTMTRLVADQKGEVNFLVLLVVRLSRMAVLEIGARAYLASGHTLPCEIEIETDPGDRND